MNQRISKRSAPTHPKQIITLSEVYLEVIMINYSLVIVSNTKEEILPSARI